MFPVLPHTALIGSRSKLSFKNALRTEDVALYTARLALCGVRRCSEIELTRLFGIKWLDVIGPWNAIACASWQHLAVDKAGSPRLNAMQSGMNHTSEMGISITVQELENMIFDKGLPSHYRGFAPLVDSRR